MEWLRRVILGVATFAFPFVSLLVVHINVPADGLQRDPNSAAYVTTTGATESVHPDFGSGTSINEPEELQERANEERFDWQTPTLP